LKLHSEIKVYGDIEFRGKCPIESAEQITFFNILRSKYPDTYGLVAFHPRNEGKRSNNQTARQKSEGLTKGVSDVFIPGFPSFVCEIKRQDHTKSRWEEGQLPYLLTSKKLGSFVCVALGYKAALEALQDWEGVATTVATKQNRGN